MIFLGGWDIHLIICKTNTSIWRAVIKYHSWVGEVFFKKFIYSIHHSLIGSHMIYSWVRQVLINIFIKNIQISLTGSLEYYSCWKKDFLNHFQAQDILLSSLMNPTTRTALFFHPSATSKYKQKILFQIQTKYIDQQLEQVDDILWPQNVSKIFGVSTFMFLALGLKIQRRNLDRKHF